MYCDIHNYIFGCVSRKEDEIFRYMALYSNAKVTIEICWSIFGCVQRKKEGLFGYLEGHPDMPRCIFGYVK